MAITLENAQQTPLQFALEVAQKNAEEQPSLWNPVIQNLTIAERLIKDDTPDKETGKTSPIMIVLETSNAIDSLREKNELSNDEASTLKEQISSLTQSPAYLALTSLEASITSNPESFDQAVNETTINASRNAVEVGIDSITRGSIKKLYDAVKENDQNKANDAIKEMGEKIDSLEGALLDSQEVSKEYVEILQDLHEELENFVNEGINEHANEINAVLPFMISQPITGTDITPNERSAGFLLKDAVSKTPTKEHTKGAININNVMEAIEENYQQKHGSALEWASESVILVSSNEQTQQSELSKTDSEISLNELSSNTLEPQEQQDPSEKKAVELSQEEQQVQSALDAIEQITALYPAKQVVADYIKSGDKSKLSSLTDEQLIDVITGKDLYALNPLPQQHPWSQAYVEMYGGNDLDPYKEKFENLLNEALQNSDKSKTDFLQDILHAIVNDGKTLTGKPTPLAAADYIGTNQEQNNNLYKNLDNILSNKEVSSKLSKATIDRATEQMKLVTNFQLQMSTPLFEERLANMGNRTLESNQVSMEVEEHLNAWKETVEKYGDLIDESLHRPRLTNADLSNSDLSNIDFMGADVTGVNFTGSNLSGANLEGVIGLTAEQLAQAGNIRDVQGVEPTLINEALHQQKGWFGQLIDMICDLLHVARPGEVVATPDNLDPHNTEKVHEEAIKVLQQLNPELEESVIRGKLNSPEAQVFIQEQQINYLSQQVANDMGEHKEMVQEGVKTYLTNRTQAADVTNNALFDFEHFTKGLQAEQLNEVTNMLKKASQDILQESVKDSKSFVESLNQNATLKQNLNNAMSR